MVVEETITMVTAYLEKHANQAGIEGVPVRPPAAG
jgi:hypothetical protein